MMNGDYIQFRYGGKLWRLQRAGKNCIRCVVTMEEQVAEPSMIICDEAKALLAEGKEIMPCGGSGLTAEEVCLICGELKATADGATGGVVFSRVSDGRVLLRVPGAELVRQDVIRYTTGGEEPVVERVKTVDGERNFIKNLKPEKVRTAYRAKLFFDFADDEGIYGFGQSEDGIWNWRHQNQYLYQHNMRTPMPCFVSDRLYGVLADCGSLMTFQDDALGTYLFMNTVRQLDFYVAAGACADEIVDAFRSLTGRAVMLPKWAFGYVQSKERYRSAKELADTVRQYRERGVPLDVIVQDWYSWSEDHWGEKVLDPDRYADMPERAEEIHAMHAHTMVSVWPNMNRGTRDYEQFMERGFLLNDLCTYDAFDAEARRLYWEQAREGLWEKGFDSWWCDSTEPFSGPDWNGEAKREPWERFALVGGEHDHFLDPSVANLFALAHARGMYENQRADAPDRRMLNLTRSGYASGQRYGAVLWSGDIAAKWSVLRAQIAEGLNVAMSGYPYWTLDAGAFFTVKDCWQKRGCGCENDPSPKWFWCGDFEDGVADLGYRELYVRWLQLACFLPMFRSHGTDTPREIWNFGEMGEPFYDAIADCIHLRYHLMPYIYSLAGQVWRENGTMMRPLFFDFPEDKRAVARSDEFMFGPALLVCPVTEPMYYERGSRPLADGDKTRKCYLPKGCLWHSYRDGAAYEGGHEVCVDAPLDRIPLFVRGGAIVPCVDGLQYAEQEPEEKVKVKLYPAGRSRAGADRYRFVMYEDAGDGYAYENGEYTLTEFRWDGSDPASLRVRRKAPGSDWAELGSEAVTEEYEIVYADSLDV